MPREPLAIVLPDNAQRQTAGRPTKRRRGNAGRPRLGLGQRSLAPEAAESETGFAAADRQWAAAASAQGAGFPVAGTSEGAGAGDLGGAK